jgi:hypothetical protein
MGDGMEVGIHGGVDGLLSGSNNGIGEPDGGTGGFAGVGCMEQVIRIYSDVLPRTHFLIMAPFTHTTGSANHTAGTWATQSLPGASTCCAYAGGSGDSIHGLLASHRRLDLPGRGRSQG